MNQPKVHVLAAILAAGLPVAGPSSSSRDLGPRTDLNPRVVAVDASWHTRAPKARVARRQVCPTTMGRNVVLSGLQADRYADKTYSVATRLDVRKARWRGQYSYAIAAGGTRRICVSGGLIEGTWANATSWKTMHGTGAIVLDAPGATVEDVRIHGYGDSIRLVDRSQNFTVRRVNLSFSRDDCIENDWLHSGTVSDSLLDGCYNAFSARTYAGQNHVSNGDNHVWTVRNSLVRLQPMPRTYKGHGPGTAGFFKWDKLSPKIVLTGNVFRADMPASSVGLGIPAGKLARCSHNVMVWLGNGRYPDPLPRCFRVTRDVRVWNRAAARWLRHHASVALPGHTMESPQRIKCSRPHQLQRLRHIAP